ncbi:MAG: glycosyltransferase family 39 protein [Pseudomonadota bacterium]
MTQAPREAPAAIRLLAVGVFAAWVALAGLWTLPPLDRDEARFAQATAQMLETGDFIAIRFQEKERNKKPAGIYWLQAASVSALSAVENREIWAYRIPSIFGVVFAAIFTFLTARRLYDQRTALLAGLLISSAPVVAAEATIAKTDGVLLALICLAQYAFVEIYAAREEGRAKGWAWPLAFWTAHGGGILIKGPIGPMVSFLTGIGLAITERKMSWAFRMRPIIGILILVIIVAPWAFAINAATEGRFFSDAIGGDMLGKVGEAQESHAGPPGYHTVMVWVMFWPAAALLASGLAHIWRDRKQWQARFLLSWIVPAWVVFEISATKLPHYVLPLYPALAIVAAHAVMKDGPAQTFLRKAGAIGYGIVGLIAAGLVGGLPIFLSAAPMTMICFALAAAIAFASLFIAYLFWKGRAWSGGVSAALLAGIYAWILMGAVLPGLNQLAVSPRLSIALESAGRHPIHNEADPIAIAGYSEPSAIFLIGTETKLTTGDYAARLLKSGAVSAAAVDQRERDAFLSEYGPGADDLLTLAVIDGLNYSKGDPVEIAIFVKPAKD